MTKDKPPIALTPRDIWLQKRVVECIDALQRYANQDDWNLFKEMAIRFSAELHYAVTEWDKYYPDKDKTK